MSESKKLIPRRRFKEFEGAECWQSFELGKITNYIKGYAFNSCDYQSYGVRIIRVSDLSSDKIKNNNECIYIAVNKAKIYDKYSIQKFDIIITTVGSKSELKESAVGRPIMINESKDYLLNQNLVKISPQNNLSSYFLYCQLLQPKYTNYIAVIERGNANQANIALNDLWMYQCNIPSILEQDMLATFFKKLDNLINTQQKKLEKAKTLKSAYLTEMFPNEGELKPKLRFKEFEGDIHWNIVQLGEVSDIIGGGTPCTSFKAFWNGDIDWYSPTEIGKQIYLNNSEKKITQLGLEKSSAKILPIGTILYTSRAGIGNTAILAREGCTNQGFQSIVPYKNKLDSYFIYSRSNELKKYGQIKGAGSTFTEVSGKQMAQMPITLPKLSEQTQIGNFFKLLDNKIALEQKKLDKLKNIKQAYLNEMFV